MSQLTMPRRKHLRLPGYDYRQPGFYFVTICTMNRRCLLGSVDDFAVRLSEIGLIVQECWLALPEWFENVALDQFIIMPNHLHGILQITHLGPSLRTTIGSFKSAVTRLSHKKYLPSKQELWQRGYFDHIVRSETSLLRLRQYILDNPIKWHLDELHPLHPQPGRCMGIAPTSK